MKTVMVLINGFGIESKESYSVYNQELMPNLDMLTKKYMFSQLRANVHNYRDGYRDLCLEVNEIYNYSIFDEDNIKGNITNNQVFLGMKQQLNDRKCKLHMFCLVDNSEKIVDQLKVALKNINDKKDKDIYLHIVLTSNEIDDYPSIERILSKINVDLGEYAKIGIVMGLSNLNNDTPLTEFNFFLRILISEIAEKWQSFSQKLAVSQGMKQLPNMIKPFVVNDGFSISKDDLFMIWNYDRLDLTKFISLLKQVKYGEELNNFSIISLFEINCKEKIDFILNYRASSNSMASNLEELNARCLIMAKKDQVSTINYYANGLQNVNNNRINFIHIDDYLFKPVELLGIINKYDHDLMIINYDILDTNSIEELKHLLHNIDIMIGNIYDNSKGSKYSLLISSLYGINQIMKNDKGEICNVLFNEKLPIIFVDDFITKKDYLIEDGKINKLLPICYKRINVNYKGHSIVTKKNMLYRLFFK